ncbi:MAG: ParB/RepB/Spo0J family partition protein [Christensenellales bacterium]|jgi:ParB family chromosome partitioning protein
MIRYKQTITKERIQEDQQRLVRLPIAQICPNPYQPRKNFSQNGIDELSRSLQQYGLLQPISVRTTETGYELIAGERRLRAAKKAGWTHIDAILVNAYEQDSAMLALIENLQRENLHFLEEAISYLNLIREHDLTQEELAHKLGKNQSTVANKLRLLKLPAAVRCSVVVNRLTERHARALLRLKSEEAQLKAIEVIRMRNLSVKATEEYIEKLLEPKGAYRRPRVTRIYRDYRPIINSFRELAKKMKQEGVSTEFDVEEIADQYSIHITIIKK